MVEWEKRKKVESMELEEEFVEEKVTEPREEDKTEETVHMNKRKRNGRQRYIEREEKYKKKIIREEAKKKKNSNSIKKEEENKKWKEWCRRGTTRQKTSQPSTISTPTATIQQKNKKISKKKIKREENQRS